MKPLGYFMLALVGGTMIGIGVGQMPIFSDPNLTLTYQKFMDKKCGKEQQVGCLMPAIREWNDLTR